jgi:hypothetical protein
MKNPYKTQTYRPILGQASAKTIKGEKIGFLTGIVYLVPSIRVCAYSAIAGCLKPCLSTAGRGAQHKVQRARQAKTDFFHARPDEFMRALAADIWSLQRRAEKLGMVPLVRLNGTSDILWENVRLDGRTIFEMFPDVQFYDYTKHPARNVAHIKNYDLTYSFSGITPQKITLKGVSQPGARVAVVFHRREDIPTTFRGWPVIDGDDTDVRHIEPGGVVVALYAKGRARRDDSGFTQHAGVHY